MRPKALALLAVQRGYNVLYREAHVLIEEIHQARELDRLMHHWRLLRFEGKSWRLKESAPRPAKHRVDA
jgi:hypothetical protein